MEMHESEIEKKGLCRAMATNSLRNISYSSSLLQHQWCYLSTMHFPGEIDADFFSCFFSAQPISNPAYVIYSRKLEVYYPFLRLQFHLPAANPLSHCKKTEALRAYIGNPP